MHSLTRNIAFTIGIVAFLLSSIDTQAATPAPPLGYSTGGLFADYFQNAVNDINDCNNSVGLIIKGFKGGADYMKPDCIQGFLKSDGGNSIWLSNNNYKLGIGTGSADYTLDLSGSLRLVLSGGVSDGLVLTSDANGVARWSPITTCVAKGSGNNNLCHGINTLQSTLSTGNYNVGLGDNVLTLQVNGARNVGVGYNSLNQNQGGNGNTAVGTDSMRSNSGGSYNVALGNRAMEFNISGNSNIAIGSATLSGNISGGSNVAVGRSSMYSNISGSNNSAFGYASLYANSIGSGNTALGYGSMYDNIDGSYNLAMGYNPLYNNITGDYNVALGTESQYSLINGEYNTSIGSYSLRQNLGNRQTGMGYRALYNITTGTGNVALGYKAGDSMTTGSYNIMIGHDVDAPSSTGSNQLNIGNWIYGSGGNIGIGYTNPNYKLDVNGTIRSTNTTAFTWGNASMLTKDQGGSLELGGNNTSTGNGTPFIDFHYNGSLLDYNARIINTNTGTLKFDTDIAYFDGSIGLGTATPATKLHLYNGDLEESNGTNGFIFHSRGSNGYDFLQIAPKTTGSYDWSKGITLVRSNGNVGIGTTTPSATLQVNGSGVFSSIDAGKSISFAQPNPFIQFNAGGPSISLPSANNLAISTSGVERMRVDNNGNIGIADSTPSYKLDVAGTGAFLGLRVTSGASAGKVLTSDTTGNATWQSLPSGMPTGVVGNTLYHNGTSWVASSNIYNNNANIGIGTTTPGTKLHVNGGDISMAGTSGQTPVRLIGYDNASSLWYIGASNNSSFLIGDAHSWDRSVSFKYNPGTTGSAGGVLDIGQIQKNGATYTHGVTRFFTNGTEKIRIDSSGNMGIGITTPGAKLDVNGAVNATDIAFGNGGTRTQTKDNAGTSGGKSGFFETSTPTNYPTGASGWWHLIDTRHSNGANNYALQIAGSFFDQNLYFRKTNNSPTQAWSRIIAQGTNGKVEIGDTSQDFLPGSSNWDYTLQLNSQDTSSIGFHDAGANVSSIRYRNKLFTIGGDDGWGVANVLAPGTVTSAGFIYSSDKNLKKDITPLSDSLSKITSLNGYLFVWKKSGEKDIGVIAQEVEKVFPDIVHTDAETGMKSVEYGNLIAPVIEAIKSQQQIIDEQNTHIKSLEARLELLEAKMK